MRTLVLLRHGKSGYPPGVDDHDRPLAERGEREATLAGAAIAGSLTGTPGQPEVINLALVSSATRAQQTWQRAQSQLPPVTEQVTDAGVYLATDDELLTVVRDLPAAARCVLVVGHNDGLEVVAGRLSGEDVVLKTSTFAVLSSRLPWREWSDGCASLVDVVVAR